jgi:hypothetical protein
MTDLNNAKEFIAKAIEANSKAVEMQMNFYQDFTRRQGKTIASLSDERMNSLKEITECGSFEKMIEKNKAFEQQAKESLEALHQTNVSAFEDFSESLKSVYAV